MRAARVTPELNGRLAPGDFALERLYRFIHMVDLEGECIDAGNAAITGAGRCMLPQVRVEHVQREITEIDRGPALARLIRQEELESQCSGIELDQTRQILGIDVHVVDAF